MPRQKFGLVLRYLCKLRLKCMCDARVKRASRFTQKRAVSRVLHHGVVEQIRRIWRNALSEQQTRGDETMQRRIEFHLWLANYRNKQRMRELPPDGRPNLRYLFRCAEPVKPCHQRCVQACGKRNRRRRNCCNRTLCCSLAVRLQHRLCNLLDEQGNAVAALDDVLFDAHRQKLVADDAVDHDRDFALPESVESKNRDVRPPDPWWLK